MSRVNLLIGLGLGKTRRLRDAEPSCFLWSSEVVIVCYCLRIKERNRLHYGRACYRLETGPSQAYRIRSAPAHVSDYYFMS